MRLRSLLPRKLVTMRSILKYEIEMPAGTIPANTKQTFCVLPPLEECRIFFEQKAWIKIDREEMDEEVCNRKPNKESDSDTLF